MHIDIHIVWRNLIVGAERNWKLWKHKHHKPPLSKMISDVPTNVCRAQEEKLNDHFSKVSPVPEMNIKIEKIGINEIEFRMF